MFPFSHGSKSLMLTFVFFIIIFSTTPSDGYDPMDVNGNITIQWDILHKNPDSYDAKVTVYNYQLYRHIEWPPGWSLSWQWAGDEVINTVFGAEAKEQGICNMTQGSELPHCCLKSPVIIDLPPGAPFNKQVANCCRGGVLSSMLQDSSKYASSFQMNVGYLNGGVFNISKPGDFRFGSPGYTCGLAKTVSSPTKFPQDGGRRWTQALETWKVTCSFSQYRATPAPTCCVSLSAFYSETIVTCPTCSCGCQGQPKSKCLKEDQNPPILRETKDPDDIPPVLVRCSRHMCPIRVHWHIKQSYRDYWRLKITITNLNVYKNYSMWNLAVDHPNLQSVVQIFSFNYRPLYQNPQWNETGLFWGIQYYNDMLLKAGQSGNVQSEVLLSKEKGRFTFNGGWLFPRRIYFNGYECVMPPPNQFPRLPKEQSNTRVPTSVTTAGTAGRRRRRLEIWVIHVLHHDTDNKLLTQFAVPLFSTDEVEVSMAVKFEHGPTLLKPLDRARDVTRLVVLFRHHQNGVVLVKNLLELTENVSDVESVLLRPFVVGFGFVSVWRSPAGLAADLKLVAGDRNRGGEDE
ncbi:hypothetical protein V2J09_020498 [Rumex salicifolius]